MAAVQHQVSAFEDRYAYEQDVKFKINARRNALLGLWAASILKSAEADAYAQELLEMSVINPTGVFDRVSNDFEAAGVAGLQDEIRNKMSDLLKSAAQDLQQMR